MTRMHVASSWALRLITACLDCKNLVYDFYAVQAVYDTICRHDLFQVNYLVYTSLRFLLIPALYFYHFREVLATGCDCTWTIGTVSSSVTVSLTTSTWETTDLSPPISCDCTWSPSVTLWLVTISTLEAAGWLVGCLCNFYEIYNHNCILLLLLALFQQDIWDMLFQFTGPGFNSILPRTHIINITIITNRLKVHNLLLTT